MMGARCRVLLPDGGKLQSVAGATSASELTDGETLTEDTAATTAPPGGRDTADYVQVKMPAESAYLSVLRTAAAGLAARLDFTLDEIEDLRIAIDEACAMLLSQAIPGTDLECVFELGVDQVTITVSVTAARPAMPARDTFAWTVLSALAGTVDSRLGPNDRVSIVLAKRRGG
jgi:serine/threonine-protein kinase RsbW